MLCVMLLHQESIGGQEQQLPAAGQPAAVTNAQLSRPGHTHCGRHGAGETLQQSFAISHKQDAACLCCICVGEPGNVFVDRVSGSRNVQ